eukprot:7372112-Ditylum_brightwellii.AAC.1
MECMFILKLGKTAKLFNHRNKIYGACKQNPKLHRFNTDDPLGEKVETDQPVRGTSTRIIVNPVGQMLAAIWRYSKQQGTPLAFTSHSRPKNQFLYCQTIQVRMFNQPTVEKVNTICMKYGIVIDHAVVAPRHGEDVVDGLNAVDKMFFKNSYAQKLNSRGT